jgi:ATP-binding cassette subfamily B protein
MTSSPDTAAEPVTAGARGDETSASGATTAATGETDRLPPALRSMWRVCRLGYQHEPALMFLALVLALAPAVPEALTALWLKLLADGVAAADHGQLWLAVGGLVFSGAATWILVTVATRTQRRFRDRVTIALESHVARLQASVQTVAHHERPLYLDRLSVLRDQVFVLDHMYMSVFSTLGFVLRLALTIGLLMSVHPVLGLLAVLALPAVAMSSWRPGVERAVQERGAPATRLAAFLFRTATTAPAGKEVRVTRIGERLARERRQAWERWYRPMAAVRWGSAAYHSAAWGVFAAGYVLAIVAVASGWLTGGAAVPAGDVVLVLAAGAQLSAYVDATVGEIGFLRGVWLDGARRLVWLEEYAAAVGAGGDAAVPRRLAEGIELRDVTFTYPGSDEPALQDVSVRLPAGSVVAVVGENGAGKSTLVKLLGRLYRPSGGRILVDGVDLARMPADAWRSRLAGAYQDFFRFELTAHGAVGVGDLPRVDDERAVTTAVGRAGADDVVASLASGLRTQLGRAWPHGVDVSFGQWQKLALARGFMRDEPLLLVLDEPTAALDAETEHALFERYAASARQHPARGRIVVLVSHRFSTVRMADLILVLSGARLVEAGSHDELVAAGGTYAQLYEIQAAAYR